MDSREKEVEGKMDKKTDVYRELQKHLDKMPVGYPATKSGPQVGAMAIPADANRRSSFLS